MRSSRGVILLSFTAVLIVLVLFGAQLQVPTVFAVPGLTSTHTVALGANTCAGSGCHTSNGSPGSAAVTGFPSGMTYTPGVTQHLTVMVNDATQTRKGFELTARLMSNTASQAGSFGAPGASTNLGTNGVQVVQGLGNSPTFTFDWTPPATASGAVNFYLTGLAGSFPGADLYTAMYTLTPAAATPPPPPTPTLSAAPTTMSFNYQAGGATPSSQPILVSGTAASYTAAASGGTWLSATPTSGAPPGSVNVSVNPAGLAPNTYNGTVNIASTGATGSPQTVNVRLTVAAASTPPPPPTPPPTTTSTLSASPTTLSFTYPSGTTTSGSQPILVGGTAKSYTAAASGGTWLSATPLTGTPPGTVTVSVKTAGLAPNTYNGTVTITSTGATGSPQTVSVKLVVTAAAGNSPPAATPGPPPPQNSNNDSEDGEDGWHRGLYAEPYSYDSRTSGALYAHWIDRLGVPQGNSGQNRHPGLLLSKNATAPTGSQVGVVIRNADGLSLTELGFDYREGGQCTSTSPYFEVVTTDNKTHTVGGCSKGTIQQPAPAAGWTRVRFNLSDPNQQTSPLINASDHVKSIALVLDQGPETGANAAGGLIVIDNIDINGTIVGKK